MTTHAIAPPPDARRVFDWESGGTGWARWFDGTARAAGPRRAQAALIIASAASRARNARQRARRLGLRLSQRGAVFTLNDDDGATVRSPRSPRLRRTSGSGTPRADPARNAPPVRRTSAPSPSCGSDTSPHTSDLRASAMARRSAAPKEMGVPPSLTPAAVASFLIQRSELFRPEPCFVRITLQHKRFRCI